MLVGPRRSLDWTLDPLDAVRRWPSDRELAVLHSGRTDPRWSRWSVLAEPQAVDGGKANGDAWWWLRSGDPVAAGLEALEARVRQDDSLWIGSLGYDVGYGLEAIGYRAVDDHGWPSAFMRRCPGWLLHDRVEGQWFAGGIWAHPDCVSLVPDLLSHSEMDSAATFGVGEVRADQERSAYLDQLRRCLAYIAAGDVFQINLTQRLSAGFAGDPRGLFAVVGERSPAWYAAYLELPATPDGESATRSLVSASPELFFALGADGQVITRPIKGTRPADVPGELLADSEKDRAELAMIVDLLRNDLGRVCAYGSVRVDEARAIETHPTVRHGVATVSGRLHPSRGLADLLKAVMPGGSITGAPKVRAMQIIDELEPVRRGPYCGAIGWLQGLPQASLSGSIKPPSLGLHGAFNLAIRTALIGQPAPGAAGTLRLGVGGGIVADSVPEEEYDETWVKAVALIDAMRQGRLPGRGEEPVGCVPAPDQPGVLVS